jgi:hypothetical protein
MSKKRIIKNNIKKTIITIVAVMITIGMQAQEEDPLDPDGDPGEPVAPIDDWILPILLLGVVFVGYTMYKRQKQLLH